MPIALKEDIAYPDELLPDEGEALVDGRRNESTSQDRLTGGDLFLKAPAAVVRGIGGTSLAQ